MHDIHLSFMTEFYFIIFCLICGRLESSNVVISKGGYTAKLCIDNHYENTLTGNYEFDSRDISFDCTYTCNCSGGGEYLCSLPCDFKTEEVRVGGKVIPFGSKDNHAGVIISKKNIYQTDDQLIINDTFIARRVLKNEISFIFTNDSTITCSKLVVLGEAIMCLLNLSKMELRTEVKTDVIVRYGYEKCNNRIMVGTISVKWSSLMQRLWSKYYWALILLILLICGGVFMTIVIKKKNKSVMLNNLQNRKQLEEQEIKYVKTQKKAFLEYQTAAHCFPDLGSLTPRHILSFFNFTSRVFNVELSSEPSNIKTYKTDNFQEFILNENKLINWIEIMEKKCKLQQRCLVSSLLTIVLFQHPAYFLKIIKCLMIKYVTKMKEINEERIIFRKSDSIVEKLVGNWISLCMYKSFKSCDVGKRFYELFRALKCKMNLGVVDCLTNKAKYALTFDHIMLYDIEYEVLNIKANIELSLKTMDPLSDDLLIRLGDIDVQVLSLDSISQVKEKILDKAIMIYSQKERIQQYEENRDFCLELIDINEINLELISNTTKITLSNFDHTSMTSPFDQEYIMVNTMKHYNMKTGTRFLLSSISKKNCFPGYLESCHSVNKKDMKVHLQVTQDLKSESYEIQKQNSPDSQSKVVFNPVVEESNKEAYLMRLLASKQSVIPFIDAFFQSIFNYFPKNDKSGSFISFEFEHQSLISAFSKRRSETVSTQELYLRPVYFLFAMFDDIASHLGIIDTEAVSLWKSNSFILRFWVNLIKNPNFIFSVDKFGPIDGSLTTIASVLMESCSAFPSNVVVNENLPIVKQLFLKELKIYSSWWKMFINSTTAVSEESIISQMEDVVQTYVMKKHYDSSLASLQAISITFNLKEFTLEKMLQDEE